ncbi:hypothetical protein FOL47_010803 [Perkinsus chesapeaki]|uniref:Carboxylesterase type B domain-containing protein n=1 Tax=Perkinsus chesapeaki TaxID=330153 RepID=A0A7J6L163_PERCH|nr:hypothetical protein FOL47_010803 [Perkinsus chesapeaki]
MRFLAGAFAALALSIGLSGCSSSKSTTTTTTPKPSGSQSNTATGAPLPKGEVGIQNGPISGLTVPKNTTKQQPIIQDVEVFYGIPFAKSPVGDLRFKAPQEYDEQWSSAKKMITKSNHCPDKYGRGNEDCLYLNVFRPANATTDSKLPVMAWIFGGGFVDGDAADSDYDGSALASQHNVIVVSMNYRLGDLGYFASPASLQQEGTTGNWGQMDQQMALKWIQRNIGAFGGDEDRVLLFGESAGAFSVVWHIAAPSSAGLFHSAVLESSTSHTDIFFQQPDDAYRYYDWVAQELVGCKDANDMDCLRKADASKFTLPKNVRFDPEKCPEWGSPIFPMMPVGPCIDGKILPDIPLNMVKKGKFNKVPTIVGTNRDEGTAFVAGLSGVVPGVPRQPDMDDVNTLLFYMLQNETAVNEALASYPVADYATTYGADSQGFELASEMIRDAIFHCPSQELAQAITDQGGDAYVYLFNMDPIFPKWVDKINTGDKPLFGFGNFTPEQMGTFHTAEIPFVFKRFEDHGVTMKDPNMYEVYMGHPPRNPGDVYHEVSDQISCMWASMAASGKPNGDGVVCPPHPDLPDWGTYLGNPSNSLGQYLHLGRDVKMDPLAQTNAYPHSEFASKDVCVLYSANLTYQQPIIQDVEIFYGIPFADPPVRDLRFRAPHEFSDTWSSPKLMDTKKSPCVNSGGKGDEDCLYLNVFRPANATANSSLPVMAWIFGGGLVNGDAADSNYDGSALASQHNVIVVTMNYRLGTFGYFASDSSMGEEGTTGNWGQMDQQMALKWIQKNIGAFGGDKDRVLLFGESAGAFSVVWHIAAPSSAGLFHSAVLESSTSHTDIFFQQPDDAYRYYDWVAQELVGCKDANDMDCLRKADASKFTLPKDVRFNASIAPEWGSPIFPMMPVGPCIDGSILLDTPLNVVKAGKHNKVPTIVGVNRDEGTGFVAALSGVMPGIPKQPTLSDVRKILFYVLQNETAIDEALGQYALDNYDDVYGEVNQGFELASEMIRDAIFHCPSRAFAKALSEQGDDAYVYLFNMNPIFPKWIQEINTGDQPMFGFGNFTPEQMGTFHSAEIPFVFKRFEERSMSLLEINMYQAYMGHPPREPGDAFHGVSDKMSCMWANMAYSGKPVGGDAVCPPNPELPDWGTYMANSSNPLGQYLHLGRSVEMMPVKKSVYYPVSEFVSSDKCDFWDAHDFVFHNLRADLESTTTTTATIRPTVIV